MKFAVLGAGQMGAGIAQVAAQVAKIPKVLLYDNNSQQLTRQMSKILELLDRSLAKGKITAQDRDQTMAAIKPTERLQDLSDCDFIVEASKTKIIYFQFLGSCRKWKSQTEFDYFAAIR